MSYDGDKNDLNRPPTNDYNYIVKGLLAGSIVGCSELLISFPLESSKTQLQLDKAGDKRFNGLYDVIVKTIRTKGVFALYKGIGIVMTFKSPQEGIRFGVYEYLKSKAIDEKGNMAPLHRFLCGFGAGACEAIFVVTPMETIKVKLINDQRSTNPQYKGFFLKSVLQIIHKDGFLGVYQGFTPTFVKQSTNQGIRFFLVETLKYRYRGGDPTIQVPPLLVGSFGVIAGWTSVLINNPADVVKTKMQAQETEKYKSTLHCIKAMYKEGGYPAFYRGMRTRLARVGIDAGYTFMCYDLVTDLLDKFIFDQTS